MLKAAGRTDYHEFRVPYWDWRIEEEREGAFMRSRLGERNIVMDQARVEGDLFNNWKTVCWYDGSGGIQNSPNNNICNPSVDTGYLLRCPMVDGKDPCNASNPNWPSFDDYNTALNKNDFDTDTFNISAGPSSFRNFLEGFEAVSVTDCRGNDLCIENDPEQGLNTQRHLHNSVSSVL